MTVIKMQKKTDRKLEGGGGKARLGLTGWKRTKRRGEEEGRKERIEKEPLQRIGNFRIRREQLNNQPDAMDKIKDGYARAQG